MNVVHRTPGNTRVDLADDAPPTIERRQERRSGVGDSGVRNDLVGLDADEASPCIRVPDAPSIRPSWRAMTSARRAFAKLRTPGDCDVKFQREPSIVFDSRLHRTIRLLSNIDARKPDRGACDAPHREGATIVDIPTAKTAPMVGHVRPSWPCPAVPPFRCRRGSSAAAERSPFAIHTAPCAAVRRESD